MGYKAGPEMDAMIAEKVMGIDLADSFGRPRPFPKEYSTDSAAAWEIVEALKKAGYRFEIGFYEDQWYCGELFDGSWLAISPHNAKDRNWDQDVATGKTAPEVICIAALKTVGIEMQTLAEPSPGKP